MPNTITSEITQVLHTWKCPNCPFKWVTLFDPYEDGILAREFIGPEFYGINDGACPACYSGKNPQRLILNSKLELDDSNSDDNFIATTASDEQLEHLETPVVDEHGRQMFQKVGQHFEVRVDDKGKVFSVPVDDIAPVMRQLTKKELDQMRTKRDKDLDQHAKITK